MVVVDDEAGVDGIATGTQFHVVGGGVAANAIGRLKHGNVMSLGRESVRAAQAGNTGPDYCNLHPRATCNV